MATNIGVLKNLAIFTGKHLRWALFLKKVADLTGCNFIIKILQHSWVAAFGSYKI